MSDMAYVEFAIAADDIEERGAPPHVVAYLRRAASVYQLEAAVHAVIDDGVAGNWVGSLAADVAMSIADESIVHDDQDALLEACSRAAVMAKAIEAYRALILIG